MFFQMHWKKEKLNNILVENRKLHIQQNLVEGHSEEWRKNDDQPNSVITVTPNRTINKSLNAILLTIIDTRFFK